MKIIQLGAGFTWLMNRIARVDKRIPGVGRNTKQYSPKPLLGGVLMAAVVLAFSSGQAALVTYEGFPYTPSGPLSIDGQSGGTGWDANWGQFLGGAFSYSITNASLADPSGLLFTSSNKVTSVGGFGGRFFTIPGNWAEPGATFYFSILIRPENTPATNHYYGLQILSNGGDTGSGHDVFVGKTGANLNYGLEYATNDITGSSNVFVHTYSSVAAASNQTVLLVVKLEFNVTGSGPENFALYVNPTPGNPEPVTPDAVITNDIGTQNGLAMNMGNGAVASFDEIRLGNTFASVTPTTGAADPDLLTYEPFAYNQGSGAASLNGQPTNGTQGSNGWDNVTWGQFLGGATSYTIGQGSLSDPSNLLVTTGNCTRTTGGFAGRFNVYTGLPGHTNANPTYFSVLIRPDNLGPTNGFFYLQIFGQNGDDLLAGKLAGSTFWGLQPGTNLGQAFSTVPVVSNQTTFLVVRGNYAPAGSPSTFLLYVNPTPGAPEPATADATVSFIIPTQNGLAFNTQNGAAASFDEIRVGTNYADVTPAVAVVANTNKFNITSITRVGNDIVLTWNTTAGNTNVVQATSGSNGNYSTNGFVNISSQMVIAGTGGAPAVTNYVDTLGATNQPARYYRVRQLP